LRREVSVTIIAIVFAAATATLDLVLCDTSTSLIAILLFGMTIGYVGPQRVWRWGLLFGASLPLAHLAMRRGGELWGLLGLVPAFVGAYLGLFLEKMIRELRASPHRD
jgi:hypothetical protein